MLPRRYGNWIIDKYRGNIGIWDYQETESYKCYNPIEIFVRVEHAYNWIKELK